MAISTQINILKSISAKETSRIFRIWSQTLIPPVMTMIIYLTIFGNIIGGYVGDINKVSYISFITPGLIIMSVINGSYANVSGSFYVNKFSGAIEMLIISPASNWIIALGYAIGGAVRGITIGVLLYFVCNIFHPSLLAHPIEAIIILVLASMLFSFLGLINGVYANNFDQVSFIPTFIITPLAYFGGIFYNIDKLPAGWRNLSYFDPIYYLVDGFRHAFLNISDFAFSTTLIIILVLNILLFTLTTYLIKNSKRLRN